MAYAVVMVYVDAKGLPEHRVRLAESLADKFNANLIGLSALAIPPPFGFEDAVIQQATEDDILRITATLDAKGDLVSRHRSC